MPAGRGRLHDGGVDRAVRGLRVEAFLVTSAPVHLDEVEAPVSELEEVLLVVTLAATSRGGDPARRPVVPAAILAGVGVDAGLEAFAMDVVSDGLHAAGPFGFVDGDVARRVTGALPPAF